MACPLALALNLIDQGAHSPASRWRTGAAAGAAAKLQAGQKARESTPLPTPNGTAAAGRVAAGPRGLPVVRSVAWDGLPLRGVPATENQAVQCSLEGEWRKVGLGQELCRACPVTLWVQGCRGMGVRVQVAVL
ncbi:hypothetical protein HaLaN_15208 [Haematococcus lacustris]|uniref:Uncharacterized protein n=1 Tax=Haematococcus lacustris TaxID=44745 RepID=A0A699Z6Y6_HAELA|nr:hypothetical protein HaLaN_15208 [Haematococcus lacustris]